METAEFPLENIRQANAIYFHQLALIDKLLSLDSLQTARGRAMEEEIRVLHTRQKLNERIIENKGRQIDLYTGLNKSLTRQNRLLWAGIVTVTTFFLVR